VCISLFAGVANFNNRKGNIEYVVCVMYVCMCVCVHVCLCVYVCMCACVYVCVCALGVCVFASISLFAGDTSFNNR
jgi:hypothetical protein